MKEKHNNNYLKSRSTRKLWYLLKGYYGEHSYKDRVFIVKELRNRRDNPKTDIWPDCDSPSMTKGKICYQKKQK